MVIKTFTFNPNDPAFANARPGSPHPYFSTIISGSSSSDVYCTNFIRGLTSIYNSRILSSLVPDKRLKAGAEAGDNNNLQIFANPTEQRDRENKEGLLANVYTLWKRIRKRRNPQSHYPEAPDEGHLGQIIQRFSLSELQVATENFSPNNILGRGALGKVYKGRLSDGSLVAVKRIKEMSSEAEESQFHKELLMVGVALHRNLLRLRGVCIESEERLLVYPIMANGNLASQLRATTRRDSESKLDWSTRKRIALGVARGLAYLHEHCNPMIIHRDVKAENILLNEDFEAVICDFGIAKFMDYGDNHAFTAVCGTVGHIAPEYISMGSVSAKTDVYGYGVMLLELISGQRGCDLARLAFDDGVMLLDWIKGILEERKLDQLVHKAMPGNYIGEEVEQLIRVALLCIQVDAAERPTMYSVVEMLEGEGLLEKREQAQEKEMLQDTVQVDAKKICVGRLEYINRDAFRRLSACMASFVVRLTNCKIFYMLCQVYYLLHETFVIYTLWLYNATIPLLPLGFRPPWSKFIDPSLHIKRFSINELRAATMKFNPENIIGEGRFGIVYKGRLADGSLVAVKRLKEDHSKGRDTQFQREIWLSDLTFHRNLLKLRGFCSTSKERLFVYPYMVNDSVASCLGETLLDWATRKQIAKGAARGLAYLHENCHQKIIHRNFKSANILLDEDFEAVICDFGLAKLMDYRDTHVNTVICGTFAHIAPEYLSAGIVSEKTDVFGYGIMLLELISGQRVSYLSRLADDADVMLLDWVKHLFWMRKLELLVDSDIQGDHVDIEEEQFVQVALLCTQVAASKRPAMSKVVGMLEGDGLAAKWEELQKDDMLRRKVPLGLEASHISSEEVHFGQLKRFSMQELQIATDNFSSKNVLGRGGFGTVYKGRLPDGSLIAVKRLKEKYHAATLVEFKSEVEVISKAIHRNLVKLRGLCMTQTELLVVYPYMANNSLASCLREREDSQPRLGWPTRKQIALGAARGLAYLHEHCNPKIIHRDVKASNILLDEDFKALVADFGLAKLLDDSDTHVTTAVCGTIGHIAPEYLSTGRMSEKTDVFGYGVMLLELITGQRAFDLAGLANDDGVRLLDWVKGHMRDQILRRLVDPDLQGNYDEEELEQLILLALLCTQNNPFERPKMSKVVRMLEGGCSAERWEELRGVLQASNQPLPFSDSPLVSSNSNSNSNSIEELSGPR